MFTKILQTIKDRCAGWIGVLLNKARRLTLIRSVLSSLFTYHMQMIWFPINVCKQINNIFARFLWSGSIEYKHIRWVGWEYLCGPRCLGGLGIKDTRLMNQVMLAKTC